MDERRQDPLADERAPDPRRLAAGPAFGADFFLTVLYDRVREACAIDTEGVPGVLLHLADGSQLDLCHIPAVQPAWMATLVFRDRKHCEDLDTVFVPYGLITRVTVTLERSRPRAMGFRVAAQAGAPAAS